jgi:hypothetical protein
MGFKTKKNLYDVHRATDTTHVTQRSYAQAPTSVGTGVRGAHVNATLV